MNIFGLFKRRPELAHPKKSQEEWERWRRDGYFMLMGKDWPIELWCATDEDGMAWPGSFAGPDGLATVQDWISKQENPSRFNIVALEARHTG